jgi:hypothetical protein
MTNDYAGVCTLPSWHQAFWSHWLRLAADQGMHRVFLLSGPPGMGKRALSFRMAASLLCQASEGDLPCGVCRACHLFLEGAHPDCLCLLPGEHGLIAVDAVRALIARLEMSSHQGKGQVVLMHDVHRMNASSVNALLKILEEPHPGVHFILSTAHVARCLPTLLSRTTPLPVFKPPLDQVLSSWAKAGLDVSDAARCAYMFDLASSAPEEGQFLLSDDAKVCVSSMLSLLTDKQDLALCQEDLKRIGFGRWLRLYVMVLHECTLLQSGHASPFWSIFDVVSIEGMLSSVSSRQFEAHLSHALLLQRMALEPLVWKPSDLLDYLLLPWLCGDAVCA